MEKSNICKKLAVFVVITVILAVFAGCIGGKEETPIPTTTTPDEEKETIRLVVEESYPQIEEEFSLAFADKCRQILENVGFNVVDEKATQYDYTLLVEVTGKALGAFYKESMPANLLGTFLYTGASIDGSISLSGPNTDITRSFHEKESPSEYYTYFGESSLPKKPRNAPFWSLAWKKHFFLLIYDAWGIEPVIKALEDEGYRVRSYAAEALGEIGPEAKEAVPALIEALEDGNLYVRQAVALALGKIGTKEAVPALIEALRDEDSMVCYLAAEALKKITGEDFGKDQSKWQQWWKENK